MARHTHIVSLGLFHKTFHSSLLQETFCFLMYDVLLSIYKINLIKKYIMRYIYIYSNLYSIPFRGSRSFALNWRILVISKRRVSPGNSAEREMYVRHLFCKELRPNVSILTYTDHLFVLYIYVSRTLQVVKYKDKEATKFYFHPPIRSAWRQDGAVLHVFAEAYLLD